MNFRRLSWVILVLAALVPGSPRLLAQTQTSGDLTGTVTDPSGAVVPSASVDLLDNAKGNTQDTTTNASGQYRFSLLAPGSYTLTTTAAGFQSTNKMVQVSLGAVTTANVQLAVGTETTTVSVTESEPLLSIENGNAATTLNEEAIQQLPNPGNDISFTAELAPGVVTNTSGGGLGNFSSFGLGADANLFTVNGMDNNDPFLNLNNTGATDLMLGNDEVQEVSVVQNGYSAEFGGLAGAQINYITKGGTNEFHGRATYYWNGRLFNANNVYNNLSDTPKSFVNANSWGGDVGGRLVKNKVWWYANSEGLYLVIPTSGQTFLPSPQFAAATEANIATRFGPTSPEEAFYTKMFNLYASAPGYASLPPEAGGGCDSSAATDAENSISSGMPVTGPETALSSQGFGPQASGAAGTPCAVVLQSNVSAKTHDWLVAGRMDWNVDNNDRMYMRVQKEHGLQTGYIDSISPLFNLVSDQPAYQGQYQWTKTIGSFAVNQFSLSGQWYQAQFSTPDLNASLAAFPSTLIFADGAFENPYGTSLGGLQYVVPQGRNVTLYQISDDFSKAIGNHSLKIGVKFRRNDVTDLSNGINTSGQLVPLDLDAFYEGGYDPGTMVGTGINAVNPNISELIQAFAQVPVFHVAAYTLAGYFEDDWKITPNLTLNLGIRLEHQSNPICTTDCFAAPVTQFTSLDHDPTIPYNQAIKTGLRQALPSLTVINPEPRFGFAYNLRTLGLKNTVVRGGIGIFYDAFPDVVVDNFAQNPPLYNQFTVGTPGSPGNITPGGTNSLFTAAAASNAALVGGFDSGATLADLNALVPGFTPPSLTGAENSPKTPQVQKWSLEVQHAFNSTITVDVGYVGNHAIHLPFFDNGLNAFAADFVGLPTAAADPRFGVVTQINSNGISNYNGLVTSATKRFSDGQISINYTWSHALDDSSNGGNPNVSYESSQFGAANTSVAFPEDPFHPKRYNYGNADYDVTNYVSGYYVWRIPFRRLLLNHGWDRLVDGWELDGTVFGRSGTPFTVIDNATSVELGSNNYGVAEYVFGNQVAPSKGVACLTPPPGADYCLDQADFTQSPNGFGNTKRNEFRGPKYFNTDMTIIKYTKLPGWEGAEFGLGFSFFNLLNHPNYQQPVGDVSNSSRFGQILGTVSTPTTIFGSALGGDASPRLIQLKAQFRF